MRYLFHLKFFKRAVQQEKEKEKEKKKEKRKGTREREERERERKRKKKRKRKRKRKRKGKRKRKTKRKEKREREKEREITGCFCKRFFCFLLATGSALEKFAAIVNPEDIPTKVNWTLSWPSALEMCGKTVL